LDEAMRTPFEVRIDPDMFDQRRCWLLGKIEEIIELRVESLF